MLKKIALIGNCLASGGSEKIHATLSHFFCDHNIDVHNIIFFDLVDYDYSGLLINLGKMKSMSTLDKLKRLHFLRKYIVKNKFDYIIDFRYRVNTINELLISHWVYTKPVIYTVHSGITESYIPQDKILANLIYGKHTIVTVSKSIESLLKSKLKSKILTIHNLFDIDRIQKLNQDFIPAEETYILAVGRMNVRIKQFDKLIEAYSLSRLPDKNIKLLILGDGILLEELKEYAFQKMLSDKIIFKGNQINPFPYFKNALFTVLTSKNEGFSNILVESLINETPVISFDCFCGPNEIIKNNENGILVENQNIEKLTQAMNKMIEDEILYLNCKKNALESVLNFSIERIGKQWLDLMKQK